MIFHSIIFDVIYKIYLEIYNYMEANIGKLKELQMKF